MSDDERLSELEGQISKLKRGQLIISIAVLILGLSLFIVVVL